MSSYHSLYKYACILVLHFTMEDNGYRLLNNISWRLTQWGIELERQVGLRFAYPEGVIVRGSPGNLLSNSNVNLFLQII